MVVLHIIARLNLGGTAKYLIKLNNGLNKAGIKSLVATGYVQTGEIEDLILKPCILKPILDYLLPSRLCENVVKAVSID